MFVFLLSCFGTIHTGADHLYVAENTRFINYLAPIITFGSAFCATVVSLYEDNGIVRSALVGGTFFYACRVIFRTLQNHIPPPQDYEPVPLYYDDVSGLDGNYSDGENV